MLDKTNMAAMILSTMDPSPEGFTSYTITVDTAVDNTDYVFTITVDATDVTYTINSGPGATTSSIASSIRDALTNDTNNDGLEVMGDFIEEGGGAAATAVVKGLQTGAFFTVAESDANMSLAGPTVSPFDAAELEKTTAAIVGGVMSATISATQDNYDPTDTGQTYPNVNSMAEASVLRIDGGASNRLISGIVPRQHMLTVINVGTTNTISLSYQDVGSDAANRFLFPAATNRTLAAEEAVVLVYDTVSSRWRAAS